VEVNKFISSGILESYVMGLAQPEEIKQVQEMAVRYPEVRFEIERIESALLLLAEKQAPELNPELESKIAGKLIFREKSRSVGFRSYAIAASVVLAIASTVSVLYLSGQLNKADRQLSEIRADKDILQGQLRAQQKRLTENENQLKVLYQPGNKLIGLKGLGISPASFAVLCWNTSSKEVYISVSSLPVPPKGKQYQLWALVDGKPVDAGVFEVQASMQKMKVIPNAQAFAVTLEKEGGSPAPTLEAMFLMGNV
jgi:anti-sigma-K factor RskA